MYEPNQYMGQQKVIQQPIVNQNQPNEIIIQNLQLSPVYLTCPSCGAQGLTKVTESCNCANVCCCIFTTFLTWLIFQCVRGKAISCMDAQHNCNSCNALIGEYSAC